MLPYSYLKLNSYTIHPTPLNETHLSKPSKIHKIFYPKNDQKCTLKNKFFKSKLFNEVSEKIITIYHEQNPCILNNSKTWHLKERWFALI